jgi:renalase
MQRKSQIEYVARPGRRAIGKACHRNLRTNMSIGVYVERECDRTMGKSTLHVAVIGAGIAGLACARRLVEFGHAPVLLDKGRHVGGRCATRRVRMDDGEMLVFDHGAQFATARADGFAAILKSANAEAWGDDRLVPVPMMRTLPEKMAVGLDVHQNIEIAEVTRVGARWCLTDTFGIDHGPFDALVCTAPAPQSAHVFPECSDILDAVDFAPCWALMLAFDTPWSPGFELFEGDGAISLVAREGGKPRRGGTPDRWIVHASPSWSRANLELHGMEARTRLMDALSALSDEPMPSPRYAVAHRWRFARVETPLGKPWMETEDGAVLAGDWCLGARLEAAFESGRAAADRIVLKR